MRKYVGVAFAVCVVLCLGMLPEQSTAFAILSETNTLVQSNNATIFSNRTLTGLIQMGDFGNPIDFAVTGTDGVVRALQILMPAVPRDYTGDEWGLIPAIATVHVSEDCTVQNTIRYNGTLPQYILQQPTGRQLQNGWDQLLAGVTTFACTGGFGPLQPLVAGELAIGAALGKNVCGGGGVQQGMVDQLQSDLNDLRNKTQRMEAAQAIYEKDLIRQFGFINQTLYEFLLFQQSQLGVNLDLEGQINNTIAATKVVAAQLTADTGNIRDEIGWTNGNLTLLEEEVKQGFTGATQQLANITGFLMGLVGDINMRLLDVTNIVNSNQQTNLQVMRSLARNTRNLATNLQQYILNTRTIIAQTSNLQTAIKQDFSGGIFSPFLDDLGTAPLGTPNNLGQFASLTVSPVAKAYTWINPADGQPWAAITVPKYTCSSLYIVTNPYTAIDTLDLQEFIGGPTTSCSTTTEGSNYCNCWIQWQEQMCPIVRSSSGVADPSVYAAFRASMNPNVMSINASFCQGGSASIVNTGPFSTPAGLDGVSSNSLTGYINATGVYALRGTCSSAAGGQNCAQQNYSGWDNAGRLFANIPWDVQTTTGVLGYTKSTFGSAVNLYTVDFYVFLQAYQLVLTYIDTYQSVVFGSPPDSVSQLYIPFRRDPVRHAPMSCSRWAFVSYGRAPSDFIPVHVMRPLGIRASVIVTINGNSNVQSTFVLSNPDTNLLPDYQAQVGDFLSTTVQYNPPASEIVISPNPFSRLGKLTYAVVGALVDFSITVWQTVNQAIFDHEAAGAFAAQYENGIDPLTGLCVPINTPNVTVFNGGNWCALREKFIVSTDPVHNIVSYIGVEDQAIINVVIPEGQILELQQSACPQVANEVLLSDGSTRLVLQNLIGGNTANVVTYKIFSMCPEIVREIRLSPLSTNNLTIPFCTQNAPGQGSAVYFYWANGPILEQCPEVLNITGSIASIPTTQIPGSLQTTEVLRSYGTDLQLIALSAIITQSNSLLFQLNSQITTIATYVPIPNPVFFIANASGINDRITQLQNAAAGIINDTRANSVNYTTLIAPFVESAAQHAADFERDQAAAQASHDRAVILVNETSANLAVTTRDMFNYLNASVDFFDSNLAFDAQVLSIFQSQAKSGGNLNFLGDFFSAIAGLGSDALKAILSIPKSVADFFGGALGQFLNGIGGAILTFVVLGLALLGVALGLYSVCKPSTAGVMGGVGGGGAGGGGVSPYTIIQTRGSRGNHVTLESLHSENEELRAEIREIRLALSMKTPRKSRATLAIADGDDWDPENSQ